MKEGVLRKTTLVAAIAAVASIFADAADFDVRSYGAKGDGVTFDTEAVQKAIDACAAMATRAAGEEVKEDNGCHGADSENRGHP